MQEQQRLHTIKQNRFNVETYDENNENYFIIAARITSNLINSLELEL